MVNKQIDTCMVHPAAVAGNSDFLGRKAKVDKSRKKHKPRSDDLFDVAVAEGF